MSKRRISYKSRKEKDDFEKVYVILAIKLCLAHISVVAEVNSGLPSDFWKYI